MKKGYYKKRIFKNRETDFLYRSKIERLDYDPGNSLLAVYFNTGIKKEYLGVPETVYADFENAIDKNDFYQKRIAGLFCTK